MKDEVGGFAPVLNTSFSGLRDMVSDVSKNTKGLTGAKLKEKFEQNVQPQICRIALLNESNEVEAVVPWRRA